MCSPKILAAASQSLSNLHNVVQVTETGKIQRSSLDSARCSCIFNNTCEVGNNTMDVHALSNYSHSD